MLKTHYYNTGRRVYIYLLTYSSCVHGAVGGTL